MNLNVLGLGWSGAATTLVALGVIGAVGCDGDRFIGEGPRIGSGIGGGSTGWPNTTGTGTGSALGTSTGAGGTGGQSTFGSASGGTANLGGGSSAGGAASSVGGANPGSMSAGGANPGSMSAGGANPGGAGSTSAPDPCKGLEGDWSVTPIVKTVNAKLASPNPTVGSERAPIGLRLTMKDAQRCSLEFMPRWSPSWNTDLVSSSDGLVFDLEPDQATPVAVGCRDDSTWNVRRFALIAGAPPSFQWLSSVQITGGGDEVVSVEVALEGAMRRGLPELQFDGYRTYGKVHNWCTMTDPACYSPSQNVHRAYAAGSVGCPCDAASDADVCISYDDAGREHAVALVCEEGKWQAVIDGPCMSEPMTTVPDSAKLLPWESFGVQASLPATDVLARLSASVSGQTYPVTLAPAADPMASRQTSVHVSDWGALMGKTLYVRDPNDTKLDLAYGFAQLPILSTYSGETLGQLVHNSEASLSTVDGAVVLELKPRNCPGATTYAAGRLATTDKSKVVISIREGWISQTPPKLVLRDGTNVPFTRKSENVVVDQGKEVIFEASIAGQSEVGVEVTARGTCPPVEGSILKSIVAE